MTALEHAATAVEEVRRDVHERLIYLSAPVAEEVRAAIARLESAVLHHAAEKAAVEMSGCCDECDAATSVMRNAVDPKGTP